MNTFFYLIVPLSLAIIAASCTKEVKYSKEEVLAKAQAADSSVAVIIPKIDEGVQCQTYEPPCLSGHLVSLRGIEFIALEYASEADALQAAKKVRGYYMANWMFDDVSGEPMLEKFVQDHLQAKKP